MVKFGTNYFADIYQNNIINKFNKHSHSYICHRENQIFWHLIMSSTCNLVVLAQEWLKLIEHIKKISPFKATS